jgi:spore germination protein KA
MVNNAISKSYNFIKKLLLYQPHPNPSPFVLDETPDEKQVKSNQIQNGLADSLQNHEALLRYAKRLSMFITKVTSALREGQWSDRAEDLKAECQALEKQRAEFAPILLAYQSGRDETGERSLTTSLEENRRIIETLYHLPLNKDIIIREIDIAANPPVKAIAIFIDGMVDTKNLNLSVLQPLICLVQSGASYMTAIW